MKTKTATFTEIGYHELDDIITKFLNDHRVITSSYVLVEAPSAASLSEQVTAHLRAGFNLRGRMTIHRRAGYGPDDTYYCQVVWKEGGHWEDENNKPVMAK